MGEKIQSSTVVEAAIGHMASGVPTLNRLNSFTDGKCILNSPDDAIVQSNWAKIGRLMTALGVEVESV